MDSKFVSLRLVGKRSRNVFHAWMYPGEVRELHIDQAIQIDTQYPGEFEVIGLPAIHEDAPPEPEFEPKETEIPKVEVSDVNPPVDSGKPPAGGRSTSRRRAK